MSATPVRQGRSKPRRPGGARRRRRPDWGADPKNRSGDRASRKSRLFTRGTPVLVTGAGHPRSQCLTTADGHDPSEAIKEN